MKKHDDRILQDFKEGFVWRSLKYLSYFLIVVLASLFSYNYLYGSLSEVDPVYDFRPVHSYQNEEMPPSPARPPPADSSTYAKPRNMYFDDSSSEYVHWKLKGDVLTL